MNDDLKELFDTVVSGDYCIGCGVCASVSNSSIQMKLDDYGRFKPSIVSSDQSFSTNTSVQQVCPFSDQSDNEDEIGQKLFGQACKYDETIGYYLDTYAGYVSEGGFRDRGSSGGIGSWITAKLLSEDLIDGVVHVHQNHPTKEDKRLFRYHLSLSVADVRNGSKSRYYPVEMSEVIEMIRDRPGRYAVVGIPCFIKAIRLLAHQDNVLASRIKFCIGLVCRHLKSTAFAKSLAWQCGIAPEEMIAIDFRKKLPDADANRYGVEVIGIKQGQVTTCTKPIQDLYGGDWGLGFFKYKACDYCDDVVAETADLSIGDAWLPEYIRDSKGTNVVIVRHPVLHELLEKARVSGELNLDNVGADQVVKSQNSGFRHRREGLSYRLHLADSKGEWRPKKRVESKSNHLDRDTQKRFLTRALLAENSHLVFKEALNVGKFSIFEEKISPLVQQYRATYLPTQAHNKHPLWKRTLRHYRDSILRRVSKLTKLGHLFFS